MPSTRPGLVIDSGPLIASFHRDDRHAPAMKAWLRRQEARPEFGRVFLLDLVVDETHNFLRREVGLRTADAFLAAAAEGKGVFLAQADPHRVIARLRAVPPPRRTTDLTFTDVALVEFARGQRLRHVLTFDRALAGLGVEVVVPA